MAYESESERRQLRRRRRSAVRRAWLYCLFLSLPAFAFFAILLYQHQISAAPTILLAGCLLLYLALVAASLIEGLIRPLQTLSNVVSSLREGDYSFRARGAGSQRRLRRAGSRGQRPRRPPAEAARAFA